MWVSSTVRWRQESTTISSILDQCSSHWDCPTARLAFLHWNANNDSLFFWQIACRQATLKRKYWGLQFLGRECFFFVELYGWRGWDLGFNTAVLCVVLLDQTCDSLLTVLVPKSLEASSLPQAVFTGCKKEPKYQFVTLSLSGVGGKKHNELCFAQGLWQNRNWIVCEMLKSSIRIKHYIKHKVLLDWFPH